MPISPPALDDRSFDDLVEELLTRIPAHTPEWTNPRPGDPGRTLVELFAWLTDTLLYRANLIPERQRLAFLRLLGEQMRPAVAARGLVGLAIDDEKNTSAVYLREGAQVKGAAGFETLAETTVLPVTGEVYCKRKLTAAEEKEMDAVVEGLREIYEVGEGGVPYVTTTVFSGGAAETGGFDLVEKTVDKCLWIALLAPSPTLVEAVRETLGRNLQGGQQLLSVGVMPSIEVPALFEEVSAPAPIPHVWEISTGRELRDGAEYLTLDAASDTTAGLVRRGVVRLALPSKGDIGALPNDVRLSPNAGFGDRPPRLDDEKRAARLVAWVRLRPVVLLQKLSLSWAALNAVEIDQRQTVAGRIVAQSDGTADQLVQLPAASIEPATLQLQVEERDRGYQFWQRIDDLALAGRDDGVYSLDAEGGTVRFGDGVRGRVPDVGARVRVARMRAGGGRAGNLPPGSLKDITGVAQDGAHVPPPKLKVLQSLATEGGEDAETLAAAEQRIPALLRHRDRAVTKEDYQRLAAETPGVHAGRIEVLPHFKPQQRRQNVPGVVSVMALPFKPAAGAPNPRPDRPFIETVFNYLDRRRPLTTELYVIGCEYIELGLSIGITLGDGFGRDTVTNAVREALRLYLWPLAPGGSGGAGWPLGRGVRDRELEVVAARVAGVNSVFGVNLFERKDDDWAMLARAEACAPVELSLESWQLPELLSVVVVVDDAPPDNLRGAPNPFLTGDGAGGKLVAVPVVPEVC